MSTADPIPAADQAADLSWPHVLTTLLAGESLGKSETAWVMREIMAGDATGAQIGAFAAALRAKGETAEEVAGLAEVMIANATPIELGPAPVDAVDIVGTGGDRANTVNISTMAAVVIAAAGVPVVKHGNRASSSACGAADLIEELGVAIEIDPDVVAECVRQAGIGFCFSARFHRGMRHTGGPRREMGVPTVFNFLGPLTNPAQPRAAAIGCADRRMAPVLAGVLAARGQSAMVVRGEDGLDEVTTTAPTKFWVVADGSFTEMTYDVADLGIARADRAALVGGDAKFNAAVARSVFEGERGPVRDAVLVNAAAGLAAYRWPGEELGSSLARGLKQAADAIDSGATVDVVRRWIDTANIPAED